MKKIFLLLFLLSSFFSSFAGFSVKDSAGRDVYFDKIPERIICSGPGALRLVVYMGAAKNVVAIEDFEKKKPHGRAYIYAEPQLLELPVFSAGGPQALKNLPDMERVIKIKPDVVIASSITPEMADRLQSKTGVQVFVIRYGKKFGEWDDSLFDSISGLGQVLGLKDRAVELNKIIRAEQEKLGKLLLPKRKVYVGGIGFKGFNGFLSTKKDFMPFGLLGFENIAGKNSKFEYLSLSAEAFLVLNPEYVFLDALGLKAFHRDFKKKLGVYNRTAAFKNKKVFALFPYNYYMTNILNVLADSYAVASILDESSGVDSEAEFRRLSILLLKKDVYPQMKKYFWKLGENLSAW